MKPDKNLHPRNRIKSFGYAIEGCRQLVRQEPNAKIHFVFTIGVIIAGFVCRLGKYDWIALLFAIALVWIAEALNTAIEMLCNLYSNGEYHPMIKHIKDIAAAAVLIASIISIAIAFFVFLL